MPAAKLDRRHVDRRRSLTPRDYAVEPFAFSLQANADFHLPAGGDAVSLRVAQVQHQLVLRWRRLGLSGASAARDWGCSKQTWSRTVLGQRWMGETLAVALLTPPAALGAAQPRGRHE